MTAPRRLFNEAAGCTGIFELVRVTPTLRHLITNQASEAELREAARAEGGTSLFDDGLRKVLGGTIAYDELLRVAEPPAPLEN
jgi:general secretion pathway protein E